MPITIGPSEFSKGGTLRFGYYMPEPGDSVHRLAMWVDGADGAREYVASVNVEGPAPDVDCVYLKGWSENEGVPEALAKAGAVQLHDVQRVTGNVIAQRAQLTAAGVEELARQNPNRPPFVEPG